MLNKYSYRILVWCILLVQLTFAQQSETYFYYYKDNPGKEIPIDSSLNNLEGYDFTHGKYMDYFTLGNTGQAAYQPTLQWNNQIGFKSGFTSFDLYKYSPNKIKYYKIAKPISEIRYFIGSKRENIFGASFAHNLKNRLEYAADFHRISSSGIYKNSQTKSGDFSFYGKFYSKNNRFHLGLDMTFNKIKCQENGGLEQDFINYDSLVQINKELYTTNLTGAITNHKNLDVMLEQSYYFGYFTSDSINDSTLVKKFHPSFGMHQGIGVQKNAFQYVDKASPDAYYGDFFQAIDSTFYKLKYTQLPVYFSLSHSGLLNKKGEPKYINFNASAGVQLDHIELWQNNANLTTNNVHFFAQVNSNDFLKKAYSYSASFNYFLAGYNRNDWQVKGLFSYNLNKWGIATIKGGSEQQEASWIQQYYYSTPKIWVNHFKKQNRSYIAFNYSLPKWKIDFDASYQILGNYVYFNQSAEPEQLNGTVQYWQVAASKQLQYKIWHLDNSLCVQGTSNKNVLRIPTLYFKSSFYVEGKIFKKHMLARAGVDLRYNTAFNTPAWQPLIRQFYLQDQQQMKFTPILDVFVSFKVKTLRVFAKANYVNEGLIQRNYYTALAYPNKGRTFAGGLIWRFLE